MISAVIPFRSEDPHRKRLLFWVLARWRLCLPEVQVVVGTDASEPFNRSRARNNAARSRRTVGETLIVADADVVPDPGLIRQAVTAAQEQRWVLPYDVYCNLTEVATKALLQDPPDTEMSPPEECDHRLTDAVAGMLVMPRAAFDAVGGYDERFIGWGYEDNAFQLSLDTLWGPHRRLDGNLCHLWHAVGNDDAFNQPRIFDNQRLWSRYREARGNADAMKALRCE